MENANTLLTISGVVLNIVVATAIILLSMAVKRLVDERRRGAEIENEMDQKKLESVNRIVSALKGNGTFAGHSEDVPREYKN